MWSKEGLVPVEGSPGLAQHFDPFLVSAFHTLGTFKAADNATKATLRRLGGDDRIGVSRHNPSQGITSVAWLALPWSRSITQIWNQPLHDAPDIPLTWLTCIVRGPYGFHLLSESDPFPPRLHVFSFVGQGMFNNCMPRIMPRLTVCFFRDSRYHPNRSPKDLLWTITNGCLLSDAVLWIALGAVAAENVDSPGITNPTNSLVTYVAFFILCQLCLWAHYTYERNVTVHFFIGGVALFTSAFYITSLALWGWGVAVATTTRSTRVTPAKSKDEPSILTSLVF